MAELFAQEPRAFLAEWSEGVAPCVGDEDGIMPSAMSFAEPWDLHPYLSATGPLGLPWLWPCPSLFGEVFWVGKCSGKL